MKENRTPPYNGGEIAIGREKGSEEDKTTVIKIEVLFLGNTMKEVRV